MSTPKICPVLLMNAPVHMAKCRGDNCAWWDYLSESCCMISATDGIHEAATALSMLLDPLEHEKSPAGAANADEGKVEQVRPDSTSHDNKEEEDLQV